MRGSLSVRLWVAGAIASAGIAVLILASHGSEPAAPVVAASAAPAPAPLPAGLRPVPRVVLASSLASLPADLAPVVEILPNGVAALRRAARTPAAPWIRPEPAAVVLPVAEPGRLDAAQRATLLDLLGVLLAERPVSEAALDGQTVGLGAEAGRRLLSWVR